MSTANAIMASYRRPGTVLREYRDKGADEGLAMSWLFVACILFFVARLPSLSRFAFETNQETPFSALALGTFFGVVLVAPIVMYPLAALSHLVARMFGGKGRWLDARLALFWALLASTPLVLLNGLVAGFIGKGPQLTLVSILAFVAFLWIWLRGLIVLERAAP